MCTTCTGHDGEGKVLGPRQPQGDPQRLPGEDQGTEGSPRRSQRQVGQGVVSVFFLVLIVRRLTAKHPDVSTVANSEIYLNVLI